MQQVGLGCPQDGGGHSEKGSLRHVVAVLAGAAAELVDAADEGNVAAIKRLLQEGSTPVDAVVHLGLNAAHYAAYSGHTAALCALLEADADPNFASYTGRHR